MGFWDDFHRARKAQKSGKSFAQHALDESRRKRQERETQAAAQAVELATNNAKGFLRHFIEGVEKLDKFTQVLASFGVMHFMQNVPFDTSVLTQRQVDQLQQYAETLVEERRRGRSVLLESETRDRGNRSGWSGQQ